MRRTIGVLALLLLALVLTPSKAAADDGPTVTAATPTLGLPAIDLAVTALPELPAAPTSAPPAMSDALTEPVARLHDQAVIEADRWREDTNATARVTVKHRHTSRIAIDALGPRLST